MTSKLPQKLSQAVERFNENERDLIYRAYNFAEEKHKGQKRKSGQPYIIHPTHIAIRLANDNYDAVTVAAGLLHDTIEDTETNSGDLENDFGTEIVKLVEGVTKISVLRVKSKKLAKSDEAFFLSQVDNYRKILLASARDVRVMIIRLYDRLDNVATLKWISPEKRRFYARETIEIYAQIAERLGMGVIKGLLEDLSFPYAYPEEYKEFIKLAKPAYKNPERVIDEAIPIIKAALKKAGLKFQSIAGRAKHLFSLYHKVKQGKNINNIFDISALRIIVLSVEDCYKALGLVHGLYQPLPGQINDYIARPKENGYQSLHTTVSNDYGDVFEIQIRTEKMHQINEHGPAAHWSYKDNYIEKNLKIAEKNRREWLTELEKVKQIDDKADFLKQVKEELFSRQVFVFTPKGKIIKLPSGSSGVDFAYGIHSEIGNHCAGLKINDRLMPLASKLQNGDTVEVITTKKASPSRDWLKFAKTSAAKHHIKNFLRSKDFDLLREKGGKILDNLILKYNLPPFDKNKATELISRSLPYKDLESVFVALAEEGINKNRLLKTVYPSFNPIEKKRIRSDQIKQNGLKSLKDIRHVMAGCCKPKTARDKVIGYISNDHTLRVHKINCGRLKGIDERRLVEL